MLHRRAFMSTALIFPLPVTIAQRDLRSPGENYEIFLLGGDSLRKGNKNSSSPEE